MDINILLKELKEIEYLISGWEKEGEIPVVEKDIALGKIGEIYAQIKFSAGFASQPSTIDLCPVQGAEVKNGVVPEPEKPIASEVEKIIELQPETAEKFFEKKIPPMQKDVPEESDHTSENSEIEVPDDVDIPVDTTATERSKASKARLRSLYDDDNLCRPVSSVNKPQQTEDEIPEPQTAIIESQVIYTAVSTSDDDLFASKNHQVLDVVTDKKVLGDVISAGGGTPINEVIGRNTPHHMDVATKINNRKVITSIRQSIGVNDRFQFIRDLFGGDADLYSETIIILDNFTDLDDALLYINDNFEWNPDSQAVALLVDLLEHKLGL